LSRQADGPRRVGDDVGAGEGDDADLGTLVSVAPDPSALGAAEAESELELCLRLREWDPWAAPSPELMAAIDALQGHDVNRHGRSARCLLRVAAIEHLAFEAVASDQMPEWMKYNACARYCLQRGRATEWGEQS
jgi:hypothetical protein